MRLLFRRVADYLEAEGLGEAFVSPSDVELEPGVLMQPDVYAVLSNEATRMRREHNVHVLLLAIEVISPDSGRGDRGAKRKLYQRHVPECWVVDVQRRHVEQWRPGDASATILVDRIEWHPEGARAPFELDLDAFFSRVMGESR